MSLSYRDAGVDLSLAEEVTAEIGRRLGSTLFGGFIPVPELKTYDEPVLVSSIDGIGTKVRLAGVLDAVEGLGRDIVHHCVNDIAVHGARPLFFLDYLAVHRLDPDLASRIVGSIADACDALGIRLAGGETAEMPLVYQPGHFDIAGAVVGVVERSAIIDGSMIREGNVVVSLPSSGLHTNGYSLVQRLFSDQDLRRYEPRLGTTVGTALLEPHRCYLGDIQQLLTSGAIRGLAHITGGGIAGNLSRIIPDGLQAVVELPPRPPRPLFRLIEERGVAREEMVRVFNMGIGMIAVCDEEFVIPEGMHRIGEIRRLTGEGGKVQVGYHA